MFRTITTATLLSLAVTTAQAAPLSPPPAYAEMNVAYGDLNLTSPADAAVLADRLQIAALTVCMKTNDAKSSVRKILVRRCVEGAVARATSQIRSQIEASPYQAIRANLDSVRQQVASVEMP
jgi:UrcA family protein